MLAVYRVVGMVGVLWSQICDALLSARTRANDPEAVALVLDSLRTMQRRSLANAMLSISLGRPDLTPQLASIRCPTVRHRLRPRGVDDRAGGVEEPAARQGSAAVIPDAAYLTPLEAPTETILDRSRPLGAVAS